jgi:hypothetical protein
MGYIPGRDEDEKDNARTTGPCCTRDVDDELQLGPVTVMARFGDSHSKGGKTTVSGEDQELS